MKLDVDPFLVGMINFEEKRVLVCTSQADTTKGKGVVVSDELKIRITKTRNPDTGVWKENTLRKSYKRWKPTSGFLMEKYARERQDGVFDRLGGYKRGRSPGYQLRGNTEYKRLHGHGYEATHRYHRSRMGSRINIGQGVTHGAISGRAGRAEVVWCRRQTQPSYDQSTNAQGKEEVEEQVSEAIVLVGSVPCWVPDEVNNNLAGNLGRQGPGSSGDDHRAKRTRLLTSVGREVVGPEYSKEPCVTFASKDIGRVTHRVTQEVKVTRGVRQPATCRAEGCRGDEMNRAGHLEGLVEPDSSIVKRPA
jgi:hypothetical protein